MQQQVIVGRVSGLYGVRGWLKILSFTEPRENILKYSPWTLTQGDEKIVFAVDQGRVHGKGLVAKFDGVDDRDAATRYVDAEIFVDRDQFGREAEGEYYWADLEGMRVETIAGQLLGTVTSLLATGANDVMVVEGERRRLVPFVLSDVVKRVDRDAGLIVVDWDPEF
jgi:16S rRNA processing protein RimM